MTTCIQMKHFHHKISELMAQLQPYQVKRFIQAGKTPKTCYQSSSLGTDLKNVYYLYSSLTTEFEL